MDHSGWNSHAQSMATSSTDDDYGHFLDLDFNAFEATAAAAAATEGGSAQVAHSQGGASTSLPTTTQAQTSLAFGGTDGLLQNLHQSQKMQQQIHHQQHMHSPYDQQQHQLHQQLQLQLQLQLQQCGFGQGGLSQVQQHGGGYLGTGAGGIPATPQSLEISPAAPGPFFSPHDHSMLNVAYHGLGGDVAFSPLVSPAVTPLDQSFSLADSAYGIHSTTFSPLVSPALHATTDSPLIYANHQNSSSNTAGSSPTEMDLDATLPPPTPAVSNDTARKTAARKSGAAASKSARSNKPSVRQSPIVKPQHRRKPTSTSQVATHILQELQSSSSSSSSAGASAQRLGLAPQSARQSTMMSSSARSRGSVSDENASVSPEPLSEMLPPPLPSKSATQSPYIAASDKAPATALPPRGNMPPATPASLMRLPASAKASPNLGSGASSSKSTSPPDGIDDFRLPPPVNPSSESSNRTGQLRIAPAIAAAPSSTASTRSSASAMTSSANSTPYLGPIHSACTTPRQTPQIQPKLSKKRASISTVSPALLPKLSPAIRPLLPGPSSGASGASSAAAAAEDEASKLLASKSNYTRILEGSNVLSYPSELATGLNSKRTSHKLAEQGRRNRMNTAIQQIATLLPGNQSVDLSAAGDDYDDEARRDGKGGSSGGGGGGGAAAPTPNSKAQTVEMAMEYIRELQGQLEEATRRAERAERLLGEREGEEEKE
jgi:hypothetical protein